MPSFSSTALDDMVSRRSQRQTFEAIANAYDITVHQCHRIVTRELRARGVFLPTGHNAAHCTHPFFD